MRRLFKIRLIADPSEAKQKPYQTRTNHSTSNQSKPHQTKPKQTTSNQKKPHQTTPHQTKTNYIKPKQTTSNQTKTNHIKPHQHNPGLLSPRLVCSSFFNFNIFLASSYIKVCMQMQFYVLLFFPCFSSVPARDINPSVINTNLKYLSLMFLF